MLSTLNGEEPTNKITFYLPPPTDNGDKKTNEHVLLLSFSPLFCFGYTPSRSCPPPPSYPSRKNMKLFIAGYYYYYCYSLARWILSFFLFAFQAHLQHRHFPQSLEIVSRALSD
jgi:hypothetical protein